MDPITMTGSSNNITGPTETNTNNTVGNALHTSKNNSSDQSLIGRLTSSTNIKDMTVSDLLNIVNAHQQIQNDAVNKSQPPQDAPLEEKMRYALSELEMTQRQIAESKIRYQNSMDSLQRATAELQNNNQILIQNKFEIQENKIESQRTRIELNSLKQQTIDEVKNLNKKIDLLLNNYHDNFNSLHQTVVTTLTNNVRKDSTFHKPKPVASTRKVSMSTPEGSPFRSTNADESPGTDFRYKLAKPLTNVRQIWEEYEYGLYGQPSVKSLDQKYKNRWRFKGENTTYLRRRKIFLAIENCIKMGVSEVDAIEALERLRIDETGTKRTMAWLFDNIPDDFPESHFGTRRNSSVKRDDKITEQGNQEENTEGLEEQEEEEEEEEEENEDEDVEMGQNGDEESRSTADVIKNENVEQAPREPTPLATGEVMKEVIHA